MPGKFLNLTFHQRGFLTGEDLRFKAEAIQSRLVSGDAMDEGGPNGPKTFFDANADVLKEPPRGKDAGGLTVATLGSTSLVTFNRVGVRTWNRDAFRSVGGDSIFEQWLKKVFAIPVEVLVLAGHHSNSIVWGAQLDTVPRRIFSALVPSVESVNGQPRSMLHMLGHGPNVKDQADYRRAGPFDVTTALSACRLLVVLGCNGATHDVLQWRNCIRHATGGRAPFILGWHGVHAFPRDAGGAFVSPRLWSELEALAPGSPGSKSLDFLHDPDFRDAVVKLWARVNDEAFPKGHDRRHLFFSGKGKRGPRGAGAIDPQGTIHWVVDENGTIETRPIQ